ncbi:putative Fucose-specific lectin [Seiridium unicorne]|uniref:Fucose-specific lectin n=1 Tax=Seiridium unicorne TaxID=138068 RepID=A0ABR2UFQ5_9PEZI
MTSNLALPSAIPPKLKLVADWLNAKNNSMFDNATQKCDILLTAHNINTTYNIGIELKTQDAWFDHVEDSFSKEMVDIIFNRATCGIDAKYRKWRSTRTFMLGIASRKEDLAGYGSTIADAMEDVRCTQVGKLWMASGCPSVTSWGESRSDVVYVNATGTNVLHKYYGGGSWGPSWEEANDLGGDVKALSSASWEDNRLDIVGKTSNGPEWGDFGGNFFSNPATVSWGAGRLDIIGLDEDNASLWHKYYQDGWSAWEDLSGGPFIGNPVATCWGVGRLDFWAINSDGELNHFYWDGHRYSDWESLGGEFADTPKVVHWKPNRIDIVGKGLDDEKFHLKDYRRFSSEPALLAKHDTNFLYLFRVDDKYKVRLQIWSGGDWQPGSSGTWSLGRLPQVSPKNPSQEDQDQAILKAAELSGNSTEMDYIKHHMYNDF